MSANKPNMSMFAQTCNLLRDYIKENGPLLNFPPQAAEQKLSLTQSDSAMNLISQEAGRAFNQSTAKEMTIFYCGQVIVLNVPATKAEEIMRLASKASSNVPTTDSTAVVVDLNSTVRPSTQISSNDASRFQATRLPHQPIVADLPIKTKASLSLFFEKRKNRINARAPYNIKDKESSKSVDKKPWLELAAPSPNNSLT